MSPREKERERERDRERKRESARARGASERCFGEEPRGLGLNANRAGALWAEGPELKGPRSWGHVISRARARARCALHVSVSGCWFIKVIDARSDLQSGLVRAGPRSLPVPVRRARFSRPPPPPSADLAPRVPYYACPHLMYLP